MIVHRGRLILGLLFLAMSGLIIVGLVRFGTILGFFLFYPWILSKVSGIVINPHLANIVALIATAGIYFGLYRGVYKRNKNLGYACLIALMVLQSGFMFMSERNRFFSLEGKNLRYYTTNPLTLEYQIFDRPVYDAFGQKAQPVNYRMATEIYRQQNEDKFPNKEVSFHKIKNFFAVVTGQALVYYCQDDNGTCHFFMHQGYDPESGRKLLPVTPKVVGITMQKVKTFVMTIKASRPYVLLVKDRLNEETPRVQSFPSRETRKNTRTVKFEVSGSEFLTYKFKSRDSDYIETSNQRITEVL